MTEQAKKRGRKPKVEAKPEAAEETAQEIVEDAVSDVANQPVALEPEAPAYPTVPNYDPIIIEICNHYGAAVRSREGSMVVFDKGLNSGAINLANYPTAKEAIDALKTTSLAR